MTKHVNGPIASFVSKFHHERLQRVTTKSSSVIYVFLDLLQTQASNPAACSPHPWCNRTTNLLKDFSFHSWVCLNESRLCPTDVVRTSTNITCTSPKNKGFLFSLSILPDYDIRTPDVNLVIEYISHHAIYMCNDVTRAAYLSSSCYKYN